MLFLKISHFHVNHCWGYTDISHNCLFSLNLLNVSLFPDILKISVATYIYKRITNLQTFYNFVYFAPIEQLQIQLCCNIKYLNSGGHKKVKPFMCNDESLLIRMALNEMSEQLFGEAKYSRG